MARVEGGSGRVSRPWTREVAEGRDGPPDPQGIPRGSGRRDGKRVLEPGDAVDQRAARVPDPQGARDRGDEAGSARGVSCVAWDHSVAWRPLVKLRTNDVLRVRAPQADGGRTPCRSEGHTSELPSQ